MKRSKMKLFNYAYYILSYTWGILANIIGLIVAAVVKIFFKPDIKIIHGRFIFIFGEHWGGLSLGNFVFISKTGIKGDKTLNHEIGHSLQNMLWGPLFLFVIGIPSATRYLYRCTNLYKKNEDKHKSYDSIWFEDQATRWGNTYVDKLSNYEFANYLNKK